MVVAHADYLHDGTQSTLGSNKSGGRSSSSPRKVAIIGSGIAGASAAHHLHQLTRRYYPLDITVYEREARVGGQIMSVTLRNGPGRTVEVGAVNFFDHDWCMVGAMREVGLRPVKTQSRRKLAKRTGVWDGEAFLLIDEPTNGYRDTLWRFVRSYWRYGFSGARLRAATQTAAAKFNEFAMLGIFKNLTRAVNDRNLEHEISDAAQFYLSTISGIGPNFLHEVVRPAARARSLLDINAIDGLAALMAMQDAKPVSISEGNWRLPNRMLKIAEAKVKLNTHVMSIAPGTNNKWQVRWRENHTTETGSGVAHTEGFDYVILTVPFEYHDLTIDIPPSELRSTALTSYVERHITHFTSPKRLSPGFFKQPLNSTLPEDIFTAPKAGSDDYIISITVEAMVDAADSGDVEWDDHFLYKAITTRTLPDETIAALFSDRSESDGDVNLEKLGVDWVHRQAWPHTGPLFRKEPLLDDIEIAPDLFYTAAGQNALNTMEMSCRMGFNVAKQLYYSKWTNLEDLIP